MLKAFRELSNLSEPALKKIIQNFCSKVMAKDKQGWEGYPIEDGFLTANMLEEHLTARLLQNQSKYSKAESKTDLDDEIKTKSSYKSRR